MTAAWPKHVTIIGVGLLGGSVGLAVKKRFAGTKVAGVGRRAESLKAALAAGAIESAHLDAAEAVADSDLVILATPVGAFKKHLETIAPHLSREAVVTDVGSTKAAVVRTAEQILGAGGPFVGSHPMAGSEQKGPQCARSDLLKDAKCIITPTPATPPQLAAKVEGFWKALGCKTLRMTPQEHDQAVAMISHLPHCLSVLMMLLPDEGNLEVAASGFRDLTRLAGGDVEMWRDIFLTNQAPLLDCLEKMEQSLQQLKGLLRQGDPEKLGEMLAAARKRRETFLANWRVSPAE